VVFEGMEMEMQTGRTSLTGERIDQPHHLHGILDCLKASGLELLSVESCPEKKSEQASSVEGGSGAAAPRQSPPAT
jgi:prephenate dehydratase